MDISIPTPISVIGDVHGQVEQLLGLLLNAGLLRTDLAWAGGNAILGNAILWFIGDLLDHGPDGIKVIDLVLRIQGEAIMTGEQVGALLGNHDIMILAAQRFDGHFTLEWEWDGGNAADLTRLTPQHIAWMAALPTMGAHRRPTARACRCNLTIRTMVVLSFRSTR